MEKGKQPLRLKGRGKGIMVSGFLTPGGILQVPDELSDADLIAKPNWRRDDKGQAVREALRYLEFGKDNYWTGEKMVEQTLQAALPIFEQALPDCEGLFAFDNASNHASFAGDALAVSIMDVTLHETENAVPVSCCRRKSISKTSRLTSRSSGGCRPQSDLLPKIPL